MIDPTDPTDPPEAAFEASYHGRIKHLNSSRRGGVIRSRSGQDLPFSFAMVHVGGKLTHPRKLRGGMRVRFDVAMTRRGLRVTHIWV